MKRLAILCLVGLCAMAPAAYGGSRGGGHSKSVRSSSIGPGTGAKSSSKAVRSYTRKDGTRIDAHKRSTGDKAFENHWSTKGNTNPMTGKAGTKFAPTER